MPLRYWSGTVFIGSVIRKFIHGRCSVFIRSSASPISAVMIRCRYVNWRRSIWQAIWGTHWMNWILRPFPAIIIRWWLWCVRGERVKSFWFLLLCFLPIMECWMRKMRLTYSASCRRWESCLLSAPKDIWRRLHRRSDLLCVIFCRKGRFAGRSICRCSLSCSLWCLQHGGGNGQYLSYRNRKTNPLNLPSW